MTLDVLQSFTTVTASKFGMNGRHTVTTHITGASRIHAEKQEEHVVEVSHARHLPADVILFFHCDRSDDRFYCVTRWWRTIRSAWPSPIIFTLHVDHPDASDFPALTVPPL